MPVLLVVDDEESVRYSFRYVYEEEVQVLTAAHGGRGVANARRSTAPDVVVLDLQLPDRSGLELFQDIRALDAAAAGHLHHRPRHGRAPPSRP